MDEANTLAYFETATITADESFIVQPPLKDNEKCNNFQYNGSASFGQKTLGRPIFSRHSYSIKIDL